MTTIVPKPTHALSQDIIRMIHEGFGMDDIKVMTGASWLTLDRSLALLGKARPRLAAYHQMVRRRIK
ncbi:hypothetical protein [uncultured Zoogloea sp.]|uniref:hypothetical protein n=1 Tax=uncultured Zoogloea sp. TaxID=160237 RepID=UPI0026118897|nr:hypothetical protein [uncultured Zoogloea sp.]